MRSEVLDVFNRYEGISMQKQILDKISIVAGNPVSMGSEVAVGSHVRKVCKLQIIFLSSLKHKHCYENIDLKCTSFLVVLDESASVYSFRVIFLFFPRSLGLLWALAPPAYH